MMMMIGIGERIKERCHVCWHLDAWCNCKKVMKEHFGLWIAGVDISDYVVDLTVNPNDAPEDQFATIDRMQEMGYSLEEALEMIHYG